MMKWFLENKELINMVLQSLMTAAALVILLTLWLQKQATQAQKKAIQASMFSDISGRISSLLGETPAQNADPTVTYNWIIRLLNELESFVFLVKQKCLSDEMEDHYRAFIIGWIDDLPEKFPDAASEIRKEQSKAYQELRNYYEEIRGKKAEF